MKKNINQFKGVTLRLLVVDDSSTMRRIIKNTLARLNYKDVLEADVDKLSSALDVILQDGGIKQTYLISYFFIKLQTDGRTILVISFIIFLFCDDFPKYTN